MFNKKDLRHWVVLIVDDQPDNIAIASLSLKLHGVKVYAASNGLEGLSVLEVLQPTLILLDLSMPIMDGWEMYEEVRKRPHMAETPIIALTAYAGDENRQKAIATGFNGFIAKPFDVTTFATEIEKMIDSISMSHLGDS